MVLLLISFLCIVVLFIHIFSVKFRAEHSKEQPLFIYPVSRRLGPPRRIDALWCLLLSLWNSFCIESSKNIFSPPPHSPKILQQGLSLLSLMAFFANPFERLMPFPHQPGRPDPLLQDPSLTIHLSFFARFFGFSIPYALGVSMKTKSLFSILAQWVKPWMGLLQGF